MQRVIMRSNFHRATMTRPVIDFQGSRGIAPGFLRASDLASGEMVGMDAENHLYVQAALA